jgi:hypothetical protein
MSDRFQLWCATDELDGLWCVEYNLIEEGYIQPPKSRGIDAGHEVLQVLADPFEPQKAEKGEDNPCQTQTSAVLVRERSRGLKFKYKGSEAGRIGESSDDRLGWKVPGMRNFFKVKRVKVSGRQK